MDREQKPIDFTIDAQDQGKRLDVWLVFLYTQFSRSFWRKHLEDFVLVNGKKSKASFILSAGDIISVLLPKQKNTAVKPVAGELDIVYEDSELIVVNKPAGISVHPGAGTEQLTLVSALLAHMGEEHPDGGSERPGVVHRLDKQTSGLLLWAKTAQAKTELAKQFKDKTNERVYLALVDGVLKQKHMKFESYLKRDPENRLRFISDNANGKYACSFFETQSVYGERLSLLKVTLATGRTHQIRVHCKTLGVPIIGDRLYHRACELPRYFTADVRKAVLEVPRQLLHAWTLGFRHPLSGEFLRFSSELPEDFNSLLGKLTPYQLK